jgi:hypothetical protein
MRTTFSALLAAAALLLPAASAAAQGPTIITNRTSVESLGDFDVSSGPNKRPTIAKAIRAFGKPSNSFRTSDVSCAVKWKKLGLRVVFVNLGSPGAPPCGKRAGAAQSFTIQEAPQWRTWRLLKIGMPESRIKELHPEARLVTNNRFYPDGWWLRTARNRFGDGSKYPIVNARVRDGVVVAFEGWIGAGGE